MQDESMNYARNLETDKSTRWWNRTAERYAKRPIADQATYQLKLRLTQQHLTADSNVLEFGCGTGSTALFHASSVQSILAIDSSAKMIDIADRKLTESKLENVEFRCATLFDLFDDEASFDAVLGLSVLHLIADYRASIRRAYELLVPGGVFVTSTVCMSGGSNLLKPALHLGAILGLIPRVQFIAVEQLCRDMTDAGFTLVENRLPTKPSRSVFLIVTKPARHLTTN